MNLFTVFASAKKGFQEEYASAILAWLLHPELEHGLGFSFLSAFLAAVDQEHHQLVDLLPELVTRLRSDDGQAVKRSHHIEFFVPGAFVDVVVILGDWALAIENKIFSTSVEAGQLKREYDGLKKHTPLAGKKIVMVYLVPHDVGGPLHPDIEKEYNDLAVAAPDFKQIVTWQADHELKVADKGVPSVVTMIKNLLAKEAVSEVTPINDYMRHTLKALCQFVTDDFSGYDFEKPDASTGLNQETEEKLTVAELATRTQGFVGVQHGIAGLLRMTTQKLAKHGFQYTTSDMSGMTRWLPIVQFNQLVNWLQTGTLEAISWDIKLPSKLLDKIAVAYGGRVFIGVSGGETKLNGMMPDQIAKSKWRLRSIRSNAQWIAGDVFHHILVAKRLST